MRKLLTLALLCSVSALWSSAQDLKVDVIEPSVVQSNTTLTSDNSAITSGAEYSISNKSSNSTATYWKFLTNKLGVFTCTKSGGKIQSVEIEGWGGSYTSGTTVYASNTEITASNYAQAPFSQEVAFEKSKKTFTVNIVGDYEYVAVITASNRSYYLNYSKLTFNWKEEVKQCEVPTISVNAYVPEGTVTLTAPTEGSTLTYSWGVDAEADVATATGTTVENAASPAIITIPADAEVGKTFWVRATAKLDGYADSEELSFSQVLGSNVLAAPRFSQPSGNVDRGSWLYIERPRYATTIHYTTDGGATYETSTDDSVGMTINENMTITAYATGDAPFKESEKVTYNYTVVTPTVDTPTIWPETGILPGTTLYLNADYDAYLSYSWGIKNGDVDVVKHEEETIQDSYVDITVPNDNIEIGYTLWVNATAKRDGYNDSEPLNFTYTFVGVKLDAPTFSLNGGQDLMAGTEVTIYMPSHATTLHYTLNGGEEQTSNENVTLTINENTEVKAWATGEGLYTKSDDATANFNLEVLGENVDVLVPTMWSDFTTGKYEFADHGIVKSSKTGIEYVFNGGYDVVDNVNTFYFGTSNSILYNTTGKKILLIKLESPKTSGNFVYVGLSTEAPLSQQGLSTIGFFSAEDYGVWKDVQAAKSNAQYFNIWSSGGQVSRILIEYEDTSVGVEGIASENGEAMYFDLNGAKVNSLENAVPGVYVRVANGKATKVLVK